MSLPASVPTVPRDTEEGLRFAQGRLSLFWLTGGLLSAVFFLIELAVALATGLPGMKAMIAAHLISAVVAFGLYWLGRTRSLSEPTIVWLDAGTTVLVCLVSVLAVHTLPLWSRPELVELVCIGNLLALRSFMIPSSAVRTAAIGVACTLIVLVSTFIAYSGGRVHPDAPGREVYVGLAAVIGLAPILVTTLTSRTIFGLRERVRTALQLGQYTLIRKVGEGAMGVVYEANHAMLRRRTAIKLLHPEGADERAMARFEREVQLTSRLSHPNTISIYDYGRAENGDLYYAMELLDGVNLQQLVGLYGRQPAGRVIHVLVQVAGALHEAHRIGLIHRDVKPANIFLCDRGGMPDVAKVLDFGLVKSLRESDVAATQTGALVGTPLYLAPETIVDSTAASVASDLYALGGVAYFLLTGRPVFDGASTVQVCAHHLHTQPTAVSELVDDVSPEFERLILACLSKNPKARPASADDLVEALLVCPESGSWTRNHAAQWWQEEGPKLHAATTSEAPSSVADSPWSETVAVNLADRLRAHAPPQPEG